MKFLKRLLCGFLAGISLLLCGCDVLNEFFPEERDLTVQCAPCTVNEIWNWHEETFKEFYYIKMSAALSTMEAVKCTVNGEEWDRIRRITEDLPVGEYQIRFYTEKGFTIPVNRIENGQNVRKEELYEKDLTLNVTISEEYEDIYDFDYRQANGLWTSPYQEKWYQDFMKELNKSKKLL